MFLSLFRIKLSFRSNFQPHPVQAIAKTLMTFTESLSVPTLIAHHFVFALHNILTLNVLNWIILLTLTL